MKILTKSTDIDEILSNILGYRSLGLYSLYLKILSVSSS